MSNGVPAEPVWLDGEGDAAYDYWSPLILQPNGNPAVPNNYPYWTNAQGVTSFFGTTMGTVAYPPPVGTYGGYSVDLGSKRPLKGEPPKPEPPQVVERVRPGQRKLRKPLKGAEESPAAG